MQRIEDIKEFKDIDTYYEISKMVDEVFQDRVEAHKHLVTANKEIERLNNIINELKVCNSDYYNQICTLSSKLSIINNYINDNKNCVPKHINDFINEILFDRHIKLGDENETKEN